jgi:hypothetical protein
MRNVEGDDILGAPHHVGNDEANARIKLARMPFCVGDHSVSLVPASRVIAEARVPHRVLATSEMRD